MLPVSLFLALQQPPVQDFIPIDRPGADPSLTSDIQALCPSSVATNRIALVGIEERQAREDAFARTTADAWSALGCTRALLATLGAISHEGTLMIAGDSWAQGAIRAFVKTLSIRPADRRAADALAILALNEPDLRNTAEIATALGAAASRGAANAPTLRACAELALRAGQVATTRRCAAQALKAGYDSTWHLLLLSRLQFRDRDSIGGSAAFVGAAGAVHDTLARLAIAWHLQWFVSPDEQGEWLTLPDRSRGEWARDHLASRDVRDGRPAGARLAEHFRRLEYADSAFRLKVPRMLRKAMLSRPSAGMASPIPEDATLNASVTPTSQQPDMTLLRFPYRDYLRWQVDWDDRGVIWMRFGEPRLRGFSANPPVEIWRYDIDGRELLVTFTGEDFDGSAAFTRLVVGGYGPQYCGIDEYRCSIAWPSPQLVMRLRQQDREYISAGTTADDNSPRGEKPIEVTSRLHRLWDPITGTPMALVTYALKASDLSIQNNDLERTTVVDFALRRWDAGAAQWQDTTFTRRLLLPDSTGNNLHVTGFLITPSSPGVSSWSLVATQLDHRRGRAWDVTTRPLDGGPLAISDLVLGQADQGILWKNHSVDVPLAPLNAVDRRKPVSLYYQVRSTGAHAAVQTTVALLPTENGMILDSAALQVGFVQALTPGINEAAPTLDLSRLDKGTYRLEVRIVDPDGATLTRRSVTLILN
jgi:hypothetical protein